MDKNPRYTVSRYFSIASLIGILVAAIALTELYRYTSIKTIIELGEQKNIVIAKTALIALNPDLINFLQQVSGNSDNTNVEQAKHTLLHNAVQTIMQGTSVVRIKIYNQKGLVAYSTKASQVGQDGSHNKAFIVAMDGQVTSKLIYRGTFNIFDTGTEEDNLIQTYIPVHTPLTAEPLGVFEVYTDVNSLVNEIERTSFLLIMGVIAILLVLYSFLWMIVHNADKTIKQQQNIILARRNALELLSAQLLTSDEKERKKMAERLHEGIAQSLVAVKLLIEGSCLACGKIAKEDKISTDVCTAGLEKVIPELQSVIQDVRTFAMELRPPSLDDIGLLATISWLCREFESIYPNIQVEKSFGINEQQIPTPLKVVVYRILQEVFGSIGNRGLADEVSIRLRKSANNMEFEIEDNALAFHPVALATDAGQYEETSMPSVRERVLLSGGSFDMGSNQHGGTIYHAVWEI